MIRVALAEDHHVVRAGLRALLALEPDVEVVGEEADGLAVEDLVVRTRPGVLLLDISLPGLSGFEVLARVRRRDVGTRVVVLSMYDDVAYVGAAMRAGATGYVLKCSPPGEIVAAIRAAVRGETYVGAPLSLTAVEHWIKTASTAPADVLDVLTPREREALHLAAEGLSNPEIALRLGISVRTAEQHRASVLRKLGLRNQSEIVRFAVERGLVPRSFGPPSSDDAGPSI